MGRENEAQGSRCTMIDFLNVPSPCYLLDEELLARNLATIDRVRAESGAEIIVALKACAMWRIFPELALHSDGGAAAADVAGEWLELAPVEQLHILHAEVRRHLLQGELVVCAEYGHEVLFVRPLQHDGLEDLRRSPGSRARIAARA